MCIVWLHVRCAGFPLPPLPSSLCRFLPPYFSCLFPSFSLSFSISVFFPPSSLIPFVLSPFYSVPFSFFVSSSSLSSGFLCSLFYLPLSLHLFLSSSSLSFPTLIYSTYFLSPSLSFLFPPFPSPPFPPPFPLSIPSFLLSFHLISPSKVI